MNIWGEHPSTLGCGCWAKIPAYVDPHTAGSAEATVLLRAEAANWTAGMSWLARMVVICLFQFQLKF